jgi:GT2 family glycosyltransferase
MLARAQLALADGLQRAAEATRLRAQLGVLRRSPLFDAAWYAKVNADVRANGVDPARHFLFHGAAEGRDPSPNFTLSAASSEACALNPVAHYELFERPRLGDDDAGRLTATRMSPFFDAAWYRQTYPDVARVGMDPSLHYAKFGWREGRNPGPRFNTAFYLDQLPAAARRTCFPLDHYARIGAASGLTTQPVPAPVAAPLPTGRLIAASPVATRFRIGVVIHIFYPELADQLAAAVARIPADVVALLSTDEAEKAAAIRAAFEPLGNVAELHIAVVPNRGRDVAPMLISHARRIRDCDLALHLHSKRSPYGSKLAGWFDHCIAHLADSPLYVEALLRIFDEDSRLGVVYAPPFPTVTPYMTWSGMRPQASETLKRLGLDPALLDAFPLDFPSSTMMWFRPDALGPLLDAEWRWRDFPEERGQTDRTLAHVIERLVFYVAHAQGYRWSAFRPAFPGEGFRMRLAPIGATDAPAVALPPAPSEPAASIVVPVYNQWEYTEACLRALAEHTDPERTPYEVILADDGSTDETAEAARAVANLRIATGENVGFLRNVNRGAALARGRHIVLLNNDTQVQPGWLDALLEGFVLRPDAAVVGAKLIYADGVLQEAGGVIWRDGSGMNYGRGAPDPLRPEFSYLRETDYISGAALLIDGAFWRRRGGFDERFAPAYYEDTDLCFAARAEGRSVIFHPGALVAHFEGRSHGVDITTGVKAHQAINRGVFERKWRAELQRDHGDGTTLWRARERARRRPVVALCDWEPPEYDRHAGGRYVWDYVTAMARNGYVVKLLASHLSDERQIGIAAELRRLGIEVHLPPRFLDAWNWSAWLADHAAELQAVILSRPRIADMHLDACRSAGIPALYMCHDLHGLRMRREAKAKDDAILLQDAIKMEAHERSIIERSAFAFTPSTCEAEHIRKAYGVETVGVLPLGVLREPPRPRDAPPEGADVLFVGGMAHGPNPDAVEWFLDRVWPRVAEARADARFLVIGADAPDDLLERADPRVEFRGAVSDAELVEAYRTARVAVAPLRFGAGVKGKTIEAMRHGAPLVGTRIAAEGLDGVESVLEPTDGADAFADRILALMADDALWSKVSAAQQRYLMRNFAESVCLERLRDGLDRFAPVEPARAAPGRADAPRSGDADRVIAETAS